MTTHEELIEEIATFLKVERDADDCYEYEKKASQLWEHLLAKLSEDYPERESDLAEARSGLIAAQTHTYAQRAIEALDRVIAAGPSVVERGLVSARDPESGKIYTESQMSDGLWHRERTRAEKAEAEAEAMRTAAAMYQDLDTANRERAERAEAALAAMQANWSNAKEQSKQAVEKARTAQRKAEAAEETARSLWRPEWCPVCHTYAGRLTRPCPLLPPDTGANHPMLAQDIDSNLMADHMAARDGYNPNWP